MERKYYWAFGIVVFFGIILITGCTQQPAENIEKGLLEGKVSIGPICPVERNPPEPNCQPTKETFKAWPIGIWTPDKKTKVGQIEPALDGTYRIELTAGNYVIDLEKQSSGIGGNNLPVTIEIIAGETTTLDVDIDTGIR